MTRDEAVEELRRHGFIASPRDWVLGKTITVTRADFEVETSVDGLTGYRYMVWLVPEGERWVVVFPDGPPESRSAPLTLDECVETINSRFDARG